MPYLHVHTNVEVGNKYRVLPDISAEVAKALGKPESYVMVQISDHQCMCFAGSDAPLAFVELKGLGLTSDQTTALSAHICELLRKQLGIDPVRIYIEFASPERTMWGWDKGTF